MPIPTDITVPSPASTTSPTSPAAPEPTTQAQMPHPPSARGCLPTRERVSAVAGVSVQERCKLYDVSGTTAYALRASLDAHGPGAYDASTGWHVRWRYDLTVPNSGDCSVSGSSVSLIVTVTFPRWSHPRGAVALRHLWLSYMEDLKLHEAGHAAIAIRAANRIARELRNASAPTCEKTRRSANGQAHRIVLDARKRSSAYDVTTDHGATQGAIFP